MLATIPAPRQSAHAWEEEHSPASQPSHPRLDTSIGWRCPSSAPYQTARSRAPASHQIIRAIAAQASVPTTPALPNGRLPSRAPLLPAKSSAHKRPVGRPVGLRVCRYRYRRRPLADVPKERAAIQLPETKRPFPERRAAWGWLPAAAFYPANPQPEASAGFLVPFSKKGTSF